MDTKINVQLLADRVLVTPLVVAAKTESGIIIPDTAKEKQLAGHVVAVGPGKKDEPMVVETGDKVIYEQYGAKEIKIDGKEYLVMKEASIIAVVS